MSTEIAALTDQVVAVVAQVTGRDAGALSPSTDLYADLKLDSLDALELLVALEDKFGIDIGTDEAQALHTMADVVSLLRQRLAALPLAAGADAGTAAAVSSSRSRR
jgi:acyl carrier protein